MEHWLLSLVPALLTGVVAILINRLDREKASGKFAGVVEASLEGISNVIEGLKKDINRRLDEIRENQKSAWNAIDKHNREIGRLEGKIELLRSHKPGNET